MKLVACLLGAVLVATACSSGSDTAEGVESTSTTEAAEEVGTTTTSIVEPETTTSTIPLPVAPYTGLPFAGEEAALARPAIVVKVDNHPRARPQTALDRADMVLEFRAEGVTRFMAVFHSDLPDSVGPVRSARTSDFDLLTALNKPAFAYSGANTIVDVGLGGLNIYARYEDKSNFFRARNRNAPHNLYVYPQSVQDSLENGEAPEPWFSFAEPEVVAAQGRAISGEVSIIFRGSPLVKYEWDNALNGWLRTQDLASHTTDAGDQLAPANVVILESRYGVSTADAVSPELISVGAGDATILTAGRVIEGTWTRGSNTEPPEISDAGGNIIVLAPGQVWVEWPDVSVVLPES